ncbi:hypothetical protein NL676_014521 [Syzygium grande]|nr:hypothetical protein NL676_014521 [Syzygium grande]
MSSILVNSKMERVLVTLHRLEQIGEYILGAHNVRNPVMIWKGRSTSLPYAIPCSHRVIVLDQIRHQLEKAGKLKALAVTRLSNRMAVLSCNRLNYLWIFGKVWTNIQISTNSAV